MATKCKCPECGYRHLEVIVKVSAVLMQTADNFETDLDAAVDRTHTWHGGASMLCLSCCYSDSAEAFEVQTDE